MIIGNHIDYWKNSFFFLFSKHSLIKIGSLTNHHQTESFSTNPTTSAGGFIILKSLIN